MSLAALHASLDVFTRAGRDRLHAKSQALTGFLERLLVEVAGAAEEDLTPRFARPSPQAERVNPDAASAAGAASPITILTPRDPAHRGAQLSLRAAGVHGEKLQALLHERGVCVDFRRPDVIRAAPAPLYCRYVDVVRFVDILRECL